MDKALDLQTGSKKILVASSGGLSNSKQFVVTQSKGTTIIQPADVANRQGQQQYVVTGMKYVLKCTNNKIYTFTNS